MDTLEKLKVLKKNTETANDFFIQKIASLQKRVTALEKIIKDLGLARKENGTDGTVKG